MEYLASVVGLSGSGKTTAIEGAKKILSEEGLKVAAFHDRTTGLKSRAIDDLIHMLDLSSEARLYMFLAARRQVTDEYIKPALSENDVVFTDRFYPCTIAYQGYGEGLDIDMVTSASVNAAHDVIPNRVFFLDIPSQLVQSRLKTQNENPQIFDDRELAFHNRVRQGYLDQAKNNEGFTTIDGTMHRLKVAILVAQTVLKDVCHT